jgi:hypothetical protein
MRSHELGLSQRSTEFGRQLSQGFGHYHSVRQDGHEVCIALPTGHNMDVQMPQNPGPCHFAQIDANVESIRPHHFRERFLATPRELHKIGEFLI